MNRLRTVLGAIAAIVAAIVLVVGVPIALVVLVGNPWPGRARMEMRDEVALVIAVLTVIAWLVWARFVAAVAVELRQQIVELRQFARRDPTSRIELTAPAARAAGIGLLAQRLVAAALVLLPVAAAADRISPSGEGGSEPLRAGRAAIEMVGGAQPEAAPLAAPVGAARKGTVTVAGGDTLISLARTHLGNAERWREIFELNRDRQQVDGQRLVSPSALRTGWTLDLPADATIASVAVESVQTATAAPVPDQLEPIADDEANVTDVTAPWLPPETIVIEIGDNLWELTETRLEDAGVPADDASVAAHLQAVIAANADVVEDPNLIYVGEQFDFPQVGTPPLPPPETVAPTTLAAPTAPPLPAPVVEPPVITVPAEVTIADEAEEVATPVVAEVPAVDATTTTLPRPAAPEVLPDPVGAEIEAPSSPSPIGIGEAAVLSAGVLALLAARRRMRLRASQPRARVPDPPPGTVATERRLRAIDAGERLLRVDVAVRAAAASLLDTTARIAIVCVGVDGVVELTLTGAAALPPPWDGSGERWSLPGSTPVELLAEAARSVGAPCVAFTQLGVDEGGREVLVDLEALGLLSIAAPDGLADAVVRGVAATLATSVFAEVANLIGVGLEPDVFLDHRHAHASGAVDEALELAATLVGTTMSARQSTFVLRARHTSGEAWEPAVVLTGSQVAGQVSVDLVRSASFRRGGLAMVVAGDAPEAPWCLRATQGTWTLEPLGIELVPVGLTVEELEGINDVLQRADEPLIDDEVDLAPLDLPAAADAEPVPVLTRNGDRAEAYRDPAWVLMVRLLGPVEVTGRDDHRAHFERSKTLELIAWLTLHRDRSTRTGARTALWELDVRDATFANVVSEARRAMARHVEPPDGEEWLGRTLTEVLPLHQAVVSDVEVVRARLDHARLEPPELAIETLRPAVELIRDLPFAGTGYLWPDAEGITSNLVLLATSAATELAGHYLSMGDIDGVFWATGQGLKVLPGHEELIAVRMRAHARAGDLSGVRLEWESYERVLNADPWSDGEPAPKLVMLRRELLSS